MLQNPEMKKKAKNQITYRTIRRARLSVNAPCLKEFGLARANERWDSGSQTQIGTGTQTRNWAHCNVKFFRLHSREGYFMR
jgi:hypothetical protein